MSVGGRVVQVLYEDFVLLNEHFEESSIVEFYCWANLKESFQIAHFSVIRFGD